MPQKNQTLPDMEIGVGIDLEETSRFRKGAGNYKGLIGKAFTPGELKYCMSKNDPSVNLAGTFAAKEAAFKALSEIGVKGITALDFEVVRTKATGPGIRWSSHRGQLAGATLQLSISHTTTTAVAVVIALLKH